MVVTGAAERIAPTDAGKMVRHLQAAMKGHFAGVAGKLADALEETCRRLPEDDACNTAHSILMWMMTVRGGLDAALARAVLASAKRVHERDVEHLTSRLLECFPEFDESVQDALERAVFAAVTRCPEMDVRPLIVGWVRQLSELDSPSTLIIMATLAAQKQIACYAYQAADGWLHEMLICDGDTVEMYAEAARQAAGRIDSSEAPNAVKQWRRLAEEVHDSGLNKYVWNAIWAAIARLSALDAGQLIDEFSKSAEDAFGLRVASFQPELAARIAAVNTQGTYRFEFRWRTDPDLLLDQSVKFAPTRIRSLLARTASPPSGGRTENPSADEASADNAEGGEMGKDATRDYLVKVGNLKGMLTERAKNGSPSEQEYAKLRNELIAIAPIRDALPNFVLRHRTIEEFWQFIKPKCKTWRERTEFLQKEFEPILSWLEGGTTPANTNHTGRAPEVIKVLLLSANPIDSPLNIDEEFRAIDQKIRSSEHRDHVELVKHGAVRLEDVAGLLMRHKPHVVHFSGHGATTGIALTGPDGKGRLVPPDALANIFRALKDNVRVVLLNACDSAPQAEAIVGEIDCAVGMGDEIDDDAAIAFAAAFYEVLGYGRSVQIAFDLALVQLEGAGEDRSLAKLYKRRGVKPAEIVLVSPGSPR
jgi:hypothetical protein